MRRSRLLPRRGACSGCPTPITGGWVIDISARHGEREVRVLIAPTPRTGRPLATELDSANQPKRSLGDVLSVPEAEPVALVGRPPVNAHEGLQAVVVDELKFGEIDDETQPAGRSRGELTIERPFGDSVKHAAEPDGQRPPPTLPANHQLPDRHRPVCVGHRARRMLVVVVLTDERERYLRRARRRIAVPRRRGIAAGAAIYLCPLVLEVQHRSSHRPGF
jgi:hypothetical protein